MLPGRCCSRCTSSPASSSPKAQLHQMMTILTNKLYYILYLLPELQKQYKELAVEQDFYDTAGIMHLLPDAAEDAEAIGITGYPTAYLLCAVGFFSVFFVQKVLSPMLTPAQQDTSTKAPGGTCCSANAGAMLGQVRLTQSRLHEMTERISVLAPFIIRFVFLPFPKMQYICKRCCFTCISYSLQF